MKRVVLINLLFFMVLVVTGQRNNFYSEIENVVKDSTSQYFYPLLLEKVKNNPENIDEMDCYYLYYGKIFQPNHKSISFVANPERKDFDIAASKGNCKIVIQFGKIMLERNPVYLNVLLNTSMCIDKQKNYVDNDFFKQRYRNLLLAIFSTGDGKTKETAIKIVDMEDDYVLKAVLGFFGGKEQVVVENRRAYSVWTKGNEKLYFEDLLDY